MSEFCEKQPDILPKTLPAGTRYAIGIGSCPDYHFRFVETATLGKTPGGRVAYQGRIRRCSNNELLAWEGNAEPSQIDWGAPASGTAAPDEVISPCRSCGEDRAPGSSGGESGLCGACAARVGACSSCGATAVLTAVVSGYFCPYCAHSTEKAHSERAAADSLTARAMLNTEAHPNELRARKNLAAWERAELARGIPATDARELAKPHPWSNFDE